MKQEYNKFRANHESLLELTQFDANLSEVAKAFLQR
jgi:hypothetical protein